MTETRLFDAAPQHGPRPLPLFLDMLRSETAGSPDRLAAALRGLAAYQGAPRAEPPAPLPVIARVGRACLRDAGGSGPPAVFVPSLINPPAILDLAPDRSLIRWMAGRGVRALLVDWGEPGVEERDLDIAGHVERLLLPLIAALGERAALVGYCLGGTMALAAAGPANARAVATVAAPWRFAGYGERARQAAGDLWRAARPACEALGLVPMEVFQTAFWRLDPERTVAKFERFCRLAPGSDARRAFVRLEDWTNAGGPLTLAAGRDLFEAFLQDDLPGRGEWRVAGGIADSRAPPCPAVEFVSLTDRIVPAASAAGLADRRELALGHVGMMVGGRAKDALWAPLAGWLGRSSCVDERA